jgi:hypothetical protein
MTSLRVQQRGKWTPGAGNPDELMSDIALHALRQLLPEYQPSDNKGWTALSQIYLTVRIRKMPQPEGLMTLMLLQWLTVYYYDLNRDVTRYLNRSILLLLSSTKFEESESNSSVDLLRQFIKATSHLTATEFGALDDTWLPEEYNPVWAAIGTSTLKLSSMQVKLLQVWDQDLRFRLNDFDADLNMRLNELSSVGLSPKDFLKEIYNI